MDRSSVVIILLSTVAIVVTLMIITAPAIDGTRNACRAANPGYECVRGWVKGEPFK